MKRDYLMIRYLSVLGLAGLVLAQGCAFSRLTPQASRFTTEMVHVPAGWFVMGSTDRDGRIGFEIGVDELPQRKVYVRSFYMDRYEVTEAQYLEFLKATGSKKHPGYWKEAGREDRFPDGYDSYPVSDIDWFDAVSYCRWAGKRLPSEAEWEKAARGTDGRLWPWGNRFEPGRANTLESSAAWTAPEGQERYNVKGWKSPVGSHPEDVSPYGVYDMAGNVREWTDTAYQSYPGNTTRIVKDSGSFKIIRGGSYLTEAVLSRTATRLAVLPTVGPRAADGWHSDYTYGFRCVRD
ncbi:MAG: SUMF1/EgtB/PvdO family nonheme iron enzyme [Nitrospirae bacterium]|nr:SUMF1/EgtB/PvdO family nonheme iron enzyme [Nitrospirota bacterium]